VIRVLTESWSREIEKLFERYTSPKYGLTADQVSKRIAEELGVSLVTVNVNFLIGMLFIILRIRVRMLLGVRGAGRGRRKDYVL
jgi:hypothetical protein